ncbi:Thioredoxin-domain-containing protein [Mycena sanguinolenta]|uniref:Thioredoxin-domain-containing protein n=1 Tax=Mycena sanguinolenta TaxID=230812 RepID=A0A8H6Z5D8_9AGAR|nr:Thioredoxin-domain-containing protein [Mycena sanguinolenta]
MSEPTEGTAITEITSLEQLADVLSRSKSEFKASVINFGRPSCPGCHAIKPCFEELSESHKTQMNFFTCDVTLAPEVAAMYKITALPTFVFFKGDRQTDKVISDKKSRLREAVLGASGKRRYSGSF